MIRRTPCTPANVRKRRRYIWKRRAGLAGSCNTVRPERTLRELRFHGRRGSRRRVQLQRRGKLGAKVSAIAERALKRPSRRASRDKSICPCRRCRFLECGNEENFKHLLARWPRPRFHVSGGESHLGFQNLFLSLGK